MTRTIGMMIAVGAAVVAAGAYVWTQGLRSAKLEQVSVGRMDPTVDKGSIRLQSGYAKHGWVALSFRVDRSCTAETTATAGRATLVISGAVLESSESAVTLRFETSSSDMMTFHFHPTGRQADALLMPRTTATVDVPVRGQCGERHYRVLLRTQSSH